MSSADSPHLRFAQRALWNRATGLTGTARAIGAYLMNRMSNSYDSAFPSAKKIAEDTGFSVDVVYDATAALIGHGLIGRDLKPGGRGAYVYRVTNTQRLVDAIATYAEGERQKRNLRLSATRAKGGEPAPTPGSEPHVAESQGSPAASSTSGCQPYVPQAASLTEEDHLSNHISDHSGQPTFGQPTDGANPESWNGAIAGEDPKPSETRAGGLDAVRRQMINAAPQPDVAPATSAYAVKPASEVKRRGGEKVALEQNPVTGEFRFVNGMGAQLRDQLVERYPTISLEGVLIKCTPDLERVAPGHWRGILLKKCQIESERIASAVNYRTSGAKGVDFEKRRRARGI